MCLKILSRQQHYHSAAANFEQPLPEGVRRLGRQLLRCHVDGEELVGCGGGVRQGRRTSGERPQRLRTRLHHVTVQERRRRDVDRIKRQNGLCTFFILLLNFENFHRLFSQVSF